MFHDLFLTAVHRLRLLDPTRDVVVYFIPRDGDKSGPLWAPKYARLGAHVLFRDPLPLRPFDRNFYYQFDYQKLYIWNLPYWRVMFLDGDVIVQQSPALAWNLCYHRPDRPLCAVQEVGKWGGYMNVRRPGCTVSLSQSHERASSRTVCSSSHHRWAAARIFCVRGSSEKFFFYSRF